MFSRATITLGIGPHSIFFRFAALFSNYTSSKSHHRPTVGQNWQIIAPQSVGDTDRTPSGLCHKITPHSDILVKVPWGGVIQPGTLEHENK